MDLEARKQLRKGWRGRRLLACRATDELRNVIASLAEDDGADLPPEGGLPAAPSQSQIRELQNMATTLQRIILLWNDGHVSPQTLHGF